MRHPLPALMHERLRALRERPIEPADKGVGSLAPGAGVTRAGVTGASLAAARPALHEAGFTYPLLTLREAALGGNLEAMAAYCARAGVALAPHGKTAMSPELGARQLTHGAWGITVATIGQLRTYRAFGFPRLLLANELVDEAGIAWLAAELAADPGFEAYCYVDSRDGVAILDRVLTASPACRRLPVLVEIGHAQGRTGCRTDEQALDVAKAAAATGTLRVAGVAGYEGSIGARDEAQRLGLITAFCRRLRALAGRLEDAGEEPIVTAGGSAFFDVVTAELTAGERGPKVILRSGAYLAHDHGFYGTLSPASRGSADAPALRPALELWAQVLSSPEPGLALLGAGRRDVGFDQGLPVPLRVIRRTAGRAREPDPADPDLTSPDLTSTDLTSTDLTSTDLTGSQVTELNDQHAYLRLDKGAALAPGDLVSLGISHPCTTFDKWRVIPVVDDEDRVTDIVHAFF